MFSLKVKINRQFCINQNTVLKEFFNRFKSKKTLEAASIYAAGSWIFIQVLATITPYIDLPKFIITGCFYSVIFLFPFFLLERELDNIELTGKSSSYQALVQWLITLDLMIWPKYVFASLVIVASLFIASRENKPETKEQLQVANDKIAVLFFDNQTGNTELDIIGPMASHWLTEGFIQQGDVRVVSTNSIKRFYQTETTENLTTLGANQLIEGSYFLQDDSLYMTANLVESESGEITFAFGRFSGNVDQPIQIIEDLQEKILGYWYTKEKIKRFPPPRFDAYKKYIQAQSLWRENDEQVFQLLNQAIHLDSNFYEPHFVLIGLLRNKRRWKECDSIVESLKKIRHRLTNAQKDKLNFFKYELSGDYKSAYKYLLKEFERDEQDLFMNTSLMNFANYKLNDSKECLRIANYISDSDMDFDNCEYCKTRLFNLALAQYNTNNDELMLTLKQNSSLKPDSRLLQINSFNAIIKEKESPQSVLQASFQSEPFKKLDIANLLLAKLSDSSNEQAKTELIALMTSILEKVDSSSAIQLEIAGHAYELLGETKEARELYQTLERLYPGDKFARFRIAGTYIQEGLMDEAKPIFDKLESERSAFDHGYTSYELGRMYCLLGKQSEANKYLQQSLDEGREFHWKFFANDWYLRSLWDNPEFLKLLDSRKVSI